MKVIMCKGKKEKKIDVFFLSSSIFFIKFRSLEQI